MRLLSYKIAALLLSFFCLTACTTQYIPTPMNVPRNTAMINIVRPSSFWASALSAPVYVNGRYIGRIGNGGHLTSIVQPGPVAVATSPGTAAIVFQRNTPSAISFQARPGRTYTVQVTSPYQVQFTAPLVGEAAFQVQLVNR